MGKQLPHSLLFTLVLVSCWHTGYAGDPELVTIQTIAAQATSYESHLVTLQGVVRDLQVISPGPPRAMKRMGGTCPLVWIYGRATFTIEDGTGSIPVEVQGSCLHEQAVAALPHNGDLVRMTAIIHLLNRDLPVRLQAHATTMTILDAK